MAFSVRSDIELIDPNEVPLWVSEITTGQYFQLSVVAILAYDTLITMDKEVKYFWRYPRKLVTMVYFANRYIGLLGAVAYLFWNFYEVNLAICRFSSWTRNICNLCTIILIDYILMIRVLALYSQDKRLSVYLRVLLALEAALRLGIMVYTGLYNGLAVFGLTTSVTVCGENRAVPLKWGIIDWSIPMVYGFVLMAFALYKAAEFWRISEGFKGFNLMQVLIQDQIIYFILAISCCIFNIVQHKVDIENQFLAEVLEALGNPSFLCILGSRMLVNLKEAGELGLNEGTSYRTKSMSEMEFA